jgi:plasmid stability protein
MANLTIKGLPDELLAKLRQQAAVHHRSLNSEALVAFERHVGPARFDPDEMLARIRAARERMTGVTPLTPEMIERAIEEGRP